MKQVSTALAAHLAQDVTTLASCWKITRTDGVILGFTDHDVDIPFEGITYIASSGYLRSAISNTATTAVDNMEVKGFLDNEAIAEDDLRNGIYDFAAIEIFMVNWADLGMGMMRLRYGLFGEVQIYPSGLFVVELRGLIQMLAQTVGEIYVPECRADLGDVRCKIKLIPDERQSSKTYGPGERVVVPLSTAETQYRIPIPNADFQLSYTGPTFWSSTNYVRNTPTSITGVAPHEGSGLCEPFSASGSITRGYVVTAGATLDMSIAQFQVAAGSTLKVTAEFKTFAFGTVVQTLDVIAAAETAIGSWTVRDSGAVTVPTGAALVNIYITWSGPGPSPANVLFDTFTITKNGVSISDSNDTFNNQSIFSSSAFGWHGALNMIQSGATLDASPITGDYYAKAPSNDTVPGSASMLFPVPISTGPITTTDIDTGQFEIVLGLLTSAEASGWMSGATLHYYDANGTLMAGKDVVVPLKTVIPKAEWQLWQAIGPVPAGARSIQVTLQWDRDPYQTAGVPRTIFGRVSADMRNANLNSLDPRRFGGVEFVCSTAGTTNAAPLDPTGLTIGQTVADGSVVWTVSSPQYTFLGTVGSVSDNTLMTVSGVSAPDEFFQFGVAKLLTGPNAGRSMEVQSWDNTTKHLTVELPFPFLPTVGDQIVIHAGCDKSRETCFAKFGNILNFRGEPDIPGTDMYFSIGRQ